MSQSKEALSSLSDEELMLKYQSFDTAAFDELYTRYSERIYAFLRGRLRDQALVEDVFQAVFLKLHRIRHQYDSTQPLAPWLFSVIRTVMIDAVRKQKREESRVEETEIDTLESEAPRVPPNGLAIDVPQMNELPENQRKAVELRYEQELSFDEIAKKLGTSPANARQLFSRGIKKLGLLLSRQETK